MCYKFSGPSGKYGEAHTPCYSNNLLCAYIQITTLLALDIAQSGGRPLDPLCQLNLKLTIFKFTPIWSIFIQLDDQKLCFISFMVVIFYECKQWWQCFSSFQELHMKSSSILQFTIYSAEFQTAISYLKNNLLLMQCNYTVQL